MTSDREAALVDLATKAGRRRELDGIDTRPLRDAVNWFSLLAGTANVIMQLSLRPVAYGVMESPVDEGNVFKNPKRRARTTLSYIAVTVLGGADERAAMRKATNGSHARVRSAPDAVVRYRAFDPRLQKWVAACLYIGAEDTHRFVHGELAPDRREAFYRAGRVFGTTLQMPSEEWPATRDSFEEYWRDQKSRLEIDDRTRDYLMRIVRVEYLGRRLPAGVLRWRMRTTAGFLGPDFRRLMAMSWTDDDQRAFERFVRRFAALQRALPRGLRELPLRLQLRDVRRRLRRGEPLF